MALPREYAGEDCPLARSPESGGERWSLLIIRGAFYGVRRFSDFRDHLGIPRAVLAERLGLLVEQGILERLPAPGGRGQDAMTDKGAGPGPRGAISPCSRARRPRRPPAGPTRSAGRWPSPTGSWCRSARRRSVRP